MSQSEETLKSLKNAISELIDKFGEKIVAVGLFGSHARGEADERSDVDILVIVRDWPRSLRRRFLLYDVLSRHIKKDITLVDVDLCVARQILRGETKLTSAMLNILYDCIVLHDPKGVLSELVSAVRKFVKDKGLIRYRVGRAYGWMRADGKPMIER
ncbi:MAG: nucleotidyltransferase domain-containing protein [Thermoprotei archaeon]|nr:MAG: nucleotidyltransferase domain-containing protein [Thermoprotei archaeon]RLF22871.1 MAG: nucleotidyltransferase domain-containing protein [Thermoprotei archaeon]